MAANSRNNSPSIWRLLVVPCAFLCAIFKKPIFQWIAVGALTLWLCYLLFELIRTRRKERGKKIPPKITESRPSLNCDSDTSDTDESRLSLLRQVNYRVMEQLKQIYPMVSWIWEQRPTAEEISKGCTRRIKLYHCDPFNYGEVTLTSAGKLSIALLQIVPLEEADKYQVPDSDLSESDILDRTDVKQWYSTTGEAILCELIDELSVQGHKRLVIAEDGEVSILVGSEKQVIDTIPNFPPRPAWDDLCVLAREDELKAEICGQELSVSWA